MTHAGSATLISLGLSPGVSGEDSSIRPWLVGSLAIHALIIVFLTTLRFSPTLEQPLYSYEVSLINPSELETAPTKSKTKTKARAKAKTRQPKARPKPTPKPKTPPPEPIPEPLSPLPTQTASERLSDSFSGAVKSVVVPDKLTAPTLPAPSPLAPTTTEPEIPNVLENIKLPTEAPTLARAQRLEPQAQVSIPTPKPEPPPTPRRTSPSPKAEAPAPPALPKVQEETKKALQSIKAPPEAPTLKPIQPFQRAKRKENPKPQTEKLSDTFKKSIQSVKVPKSRARAVRKKTSKDLKSTAPSPTPEAPQLTQVTPSTKASQEPRVKQERLADSLKQVLGTVKIPKLRTVPTAKTQPPSPIRKNEVAPQVATPNPSSTKTGSLKSEINDQLAKLRIPDVAPIESLKERLQVQVEAAPAPTSSSGESSTPRNSPGQNRYLALIEAKIEQEWVAPRVSIAQDHPKVILKFRVLPSGEVTNLGIKQGSGNGYYDAAAKRAVKAASPLPPFPKDLKSSYLDVLYKFRIGESLS